MIARSAPKKALLLLPVLLLACVQILPVVVVALTSVKTPVALLEGKLFGTEGFFLGNYAKVLLEDGLHRPLLTSLVVAAISTAISVAAGSMAAFGLARLEFRFKGTFAGAILCARLLPPVALAVPLFLLINALGLSDTRLGLALAHATFSLPFAIWLLMPFFAAMPKELEEAALVDGFTRFQIFRLLYFPLALPGLLVASLFCFLLSWNDFLFSLILAGSDTKTAPLAVNGYMTGFGPEWGPMTASSVIVLLPVLALSLLLQRYLVGGLQAGGIKG